MQDKPFLSAISSMPAIQSDSNPSQPEIDHTLASLKHAATLLDRSVQSQTGDDEIPPLELTIQSETSPLNTTPSKVKRPMNAFLLFASERRTILVKTESPVNTGAISKKLGEEWSRLDKDKKQVYIDKAKELKTLFKQQHPDFVYTRKPNKRSKTKAAYYLEKQQEDLSSSSSSREDRPFISPKDRIKRPMNAYLLFNKEMRAKLQQEEDRKLSVAEISRAIGEKWKDMTEDEKQPYVDQAKAIKEVFKAENPGHVFTRKGKNGVTPKKRGYGALELDSHGTATRYNDPRGRKKKRLKDPLAPKHPMSGFLYYLSAQRSQVTKENPGERVGPISKMIANTWRGLSAEERHPWEEMAHKDKERYKREMELYTHSKARRLSPISGGMVGESASVTTGEGGTPERYLDQDPQRALDDLAEAAASTALAELESEKSDDFTEPETEEDELDGEVESLSSTPEDSPTLTVGKDSNFDDQSM